MKQENSFISFLKDSIPKTIWAIGFSSLLINMSTSVVFAGSALYLKVVLGVAVSTIGILEAIVEGIAYFVRIFSGVISDYFRKRKAIMIIGFSMLTISKPILALSSTLIGVFWARAIDRTGNGLQATPREALVSDIASKETKGACFGLRQSLALVGSTLGALLGIIVMRTTNNNFEFLFLLASIPAIIATIILILFVKEKRNKNNIENKTRKKIELKNLKELGKKFWILMIIAVTFMLSRFSEVFISLHACTNFGLDLAYGIAISVTYNLLSAFVAYPLGKLSDKIGRFNILLLGFFFLIIAHLFIGYSTNLYFIFIGTMFWGIQRGITESIIATLVSDFIPKDLRGTGFGVYYLLVSGATACASIFAGSISQSKGEAYAFIFGSIVCLIATILALFFKKHLNSKAVD